MKRGGGFAKVRGMIWKPNVTVAAIVEQDGRFLFVEEDTDDGPAMLNQPAGHLEPGESLLQAVMREMLEETAWEFIPEKLLGIYRWPHPTKELTYLRFAFIGRLGQHFPERPLDDGILGTVWLDAAELHAQAHRHRSPQVQQCVQDYLAGQGVPLSILRDMGHDPTRP